MKVLAYIFGLVLYLGFSCLLCAQTLTEGKWLRGRVVDRNDSLYTGEIKYNFKRKNVIVDLGGKLRTFGARNVKFFEFFDARERQFRRFVSLPYTKNPERNYKPLCFFELIAQGNKITLLKTEYAENNSQALPNNGQMGTEQIIFTTRVVPVYYLMNNTNGHIIKLHTRRNKKFLKQMNEPRLAAFIEQYKLDVYQQTDLLRIIKYYDSL